jgi:hypothetical protein
MTRLNYVELIIQHPYQRHYFDSFAEAIDAHNNLPTEQIGNCRIEIQLDDFFWTIDPLGSTFRPADQIPV